MMVPSVHMNGSSATTLRETYETAYRAVNDAIQAVQETAPHGRDYYIQSPGAYGEAAREHEKRLEALQQIAGQLLFIFDAVQAQIEARERARGR